MVIKKKSEKSAKFTNPETTQPINEQTVKKETPLQKNKIVTLHLQTLTPEERYRLVAEAAYYNAEKKGFRSDAQSDWLEAERMINAKLAS